MTIAPADYVEGLARGLAVLAGFDTERQRLNASQAAERAGISRAAARRHLLTLLHLGYLESDGQNYWLTPRVLRLSGSYLASARLPRAVQPVLNRLAGETGESFSVVVLDGDDVVIIARSGSHGGPTRVLAHGLHLGARLPAHATSTGQLLLAALDNRGLAAWLRGRRLARFTAATLTEPRQLRARIAEIRSQDFSFARDGHEIGVQALAVPLRDQRGQTVAALNVVQSGQRDAIDSLLRRLLPRLFQAAAEIRDVI